MTREKDALANRQMVEEEEEEIQAYQQLKPPKHRWLPLESNPDVSFCHKWIFFIKILTKLVYRF